ncbi:MAG: 50S ribosomal protein L19 [Ignavibacteria bacterium]|nr:50S ribosomal protein L19 [Ignavibacteria bacterium]MBK7158617.1 50S ribosomal protein L19 [Ignavibacteria bacterium]MBK9405746.1 50S ribosomal protein L19 [Ignavibacteria bacterium]
MDKKINLVTAGQIRNDIPEFHIGDTIAISVNVIEGDKERIQIFKGIVMGIKGGGISKTFRVRKISNGVGVERIFPINSPRIAKIEVLKSGSVRRAKLYYLRGLTGKAATKIKEKKKIGKVLETIITEKEPVVSETVKQTDQVKEEAVS